MTAGGAYTPGPARDARVGEKDGDTWTLVLVRELRHPPGRAWAALTDPEQLRSWAPYDADGNLGEAGAKVRLTTVGAPQPHVVETTVARADAPRTLEFDWGGGLVRWELEPTAGGTRLTLWAGIDRHWIAMGATGWHVCLGVLDRHLAGNPVGRLAGPAAMRVDGFPRLHEEYAEVLGVERG